MLKNLKKTAFLTLAVIVAAGGPLSGQVPDKDTGIIPDAIGGRIKGFARLGTSTAEFLTIPTSARGMALGGAYTALGNDLGALFWNPAGLGDITSSTFQFTNVNMNEDFSINYAAGAIPFNDGAGVAAAFLSFFTTEPEEITTIYQPEGTGSYFDSYSSVAGGALAYNISDRFAAGVSLKWVHEDIWDITANSFSMDVGANYHTEFMEREIRVGMSIQNLGTNARYSGKKLFAELDPKQLVDDESNTITVPRTVRASRYGSYQTSSFGLPTTLRIGLSYRALERENAYLSVCGDFLQPRNLDVVFALGTEFHMELARGYSVDGRFGWHIQSDEETIKDDAGTVLSDSPTSRGLAAGGGFGHDFEEFLLKVDYTINNRGYLDNWHFLTVTVGF